MRIYRRDEFLKLPEGVFFARVHSMHRGEPVWHDGYLSVKDETVGDGTNLYWSMGVASVNWEGFGKDEADCAAERLWTQTCCPVEDAV